jgi:sugar lactone lactonase YvrE
MRLLPAITVITLLLVGCQDKTDPKGPTKPIADAEGLPTAGYKVVHEFKGPMPTGVAVARSNRIFVNYPRWEDPITFTVAEIKNGEEIPYPSAAANKGDSPDTLFSVQSVVVDSKNRLWALDTGTVDMGPIKGFDWPKLVGFDLETNKPFKTIRFPKGVIHEKTYLNDVRFDLKRGSEGMAYITDSSAEGANGIIVVDLGSGRSWRKLNDDRSTKSDPDFAAVMDQQPFMMRKPSQPAKKVEVGSDGIAMGADRERLWFCPLTSRKLHNVSLDLLSDEKSTDRQVLDDMKTESRNFASDGLESDAQGRLYLTDWEHNAVVVRNSNGQYKVLVGDPKMLWPDTLSLAHDGRLYFTANELHRQAKFNNGVDKRQKPYYLLSVQTDGTPVGTDPIDRGFQR